MISPKHTSSRAFKVTSVSLVSPRLSICVILLHWHDSSSTSDSDRIQSPGSISSSNVAPANVFLTTSRICRALRSKIRILSSPGWVSQTVRRHRVRARSYAPFSKKRSNSGMQTPRLLRGTGKPNKAAKVGAISDCCTTL